MAAKLSEIVVVDGVERVKERPVYRETECTVFSSGKEREIIVGLLPGDLVELRLKGSQQREYVKLSAVLQLALVKRAACERVEKEMKRKARKAGRA
jgi:hypothetical protein